MREFPDLIRVLIDRRFKTDAEFASALGVGAPHASNVIRGRKALSLKQIDAWADALGLEGQDRADFRFAAEVANSPRSIATRLVELEKVVDRQERAIAGLHEKLVKALVSLRSRPGRRPPKR